jgi:hypothetical protein
MKDFKMTAESLKKQLTELNKIRKDAGLAELTDEAWKQMQSRQEGGNGFTIGETIHLTGEVEIIVVYANVNGTQVPQNTFFGAKLTDGRNISLRNLIKPSLAGYKWEGTFKEDNGKEGKSRTETEHTAQHVEGFDPANIDFFDAETRNVLELFMAVKARKKQLPSELTLVAQGCRPIVATRTVSQGNLDYAKGAHRVMRVNVWSL